MWWKMRPSKTESKTIFFLSFPNGVFLLLVPYTGQIQLYQLLHSLVQCNRLALKNQHSINFIAVKHSNQQSWKWINRNLPSWSVGQSNTSAILICLRLKYAFNDWHMHGLISVVFSNATVCKLQYGENCCGAICCIWLNEIFNWTKSGRTPKFGTVDNRQLAKLNFCRGATTGFFRSCNGKLLYRIKLKW